MAEIDSRAAEYEIDMSVNVDSVSVILAENKKDKVGGGGRREE